MRPVLPPPDIPIEAPTGTAGLLHRDATETTLKLQDLTETHDHTFTLLTKAREHYVIRIAEELVRLEQAPTDNDRRPSLNVEVNGTILATGGAIEKLGIPAVDINALQKLSREGNNEATDVYLRIHALLAEYMQRVDRLRARQVDAKRQA